MANETNGAVIAKIIKIFLSVMGFFIWLVSNLYKLLLIA